MYRLFTSLRFQVSAAFLALITLFAAASLTTLAAFQRQIDADAVVDIAGRLEVTSSRMHMQAMNYDAHAPRDYPTYYRDVQLFYRDLMAQMDLFDAVVDGFMGGDFSAVLDRPAAWMKPARNPQLGDAVATLEAAWAEHRRGLLAALGTDVDEPRLEWAAEYNLEHIGPLEDAAEALTARLREWAQVEHKRLRLLALALLSGSVVVAGALLAFLHFHGLRPLQRTLAGVRRATDGDFGAQVPLAGAAEIRDLSAGFNALSARLHLLFQLLDRLQHGNDLDDMVGFLSRDFRDLLRFDWIGVVLMTPDNATVRLEASALDGEPESGNKPLFRLEGTLLEQALAAGRPMHIRNMTATAAANPRFEFLRDIARRGLADVIFLPVAAETPMPAVVAFATRAPDRYDEAHLRFLTNIAQLIGASFGRTVRLAERGRLAAIGEFASAITHELRTPLATLSLALEYFARLSLPDNGRRRAALAQAEAVRMGRLLEDMLLYAKPLQLASEPVDLVDVVERAIDLLQGQPRCQGRQLEIDSSPKQAWVLGDDDHLTQILLNLLVNACEAAPDGASVQISMRAAQDGRVLVAISNPGPPIPSDLLDRIFEPFVSAKAGGTGLGLAIVQRLTALHGGEVRLHSTAGKILAELWLPLTVVAG